MSLQNGDFEQESMVAQGLPAYWTVTALGQAQSVALFYSSYPWESFASDVGWDSTYSFVLVDPEAASFGTRFVAPKYVEDFEELWNSNESYEWELSSTELALWNGGTESAETFEWGEWQTEFEPGDLDAAIFWSTWIAWEEFKAQYGWDTGYKTEFVGVGSDLTAATYAYLSGGGSTIYANYEGFLQYRPEQSFSVDVSTNRITVPAAHNMMGGSVHEPLFFVAGDGGTLPAPLSEANRYYATVVDTKTFTVSLNATGTPTVDITDLGTGINTEHGDPAVHWWLVLNI